MLKEDLQLYKGVFWIFDLDNLDNNRNYCFTIPSDIYGNPISDTDELNAKSGRTYNHERLWASLPRNMTLGHDFNYFPRGRVEIANQKATVYLNPNINTPEIQDFIKEQFNLYTKNGIKNVVFHSDGSEHYKCYLDE